MSDKRPSIKVVLYKSKTLANGEHPIMLSVSYNGSRKYKSLGISCSPKYWNPDGKEKVMKSHPQSKLLNRTIQNELNRAYSQYLQYENSDKQYSAQTIVKAVTKDAPSTKTLFELFDERVKFFRKTDSNNTADGYNTLSNIFKRYLDNKDIELFSIDADWITDFELWLRKDYRDTSIKKFFDCFKAAMNFAVKKKYIEKSPLDGYEHVKKLDLKTKKRALSMPEITKLTKYYFESYGVFGEKTKPVEEKCKKHYWNKHFRRRGSTKLTPIDAEQLSLALFLCSYYFQGLALVDLAKLKWQDLRTLKLRDEKKFAYDSGKYGFEYAMQHIEEKECYEIDIARSKTGKPVKIVVEVQNVIMYLNPFMPDGDVSDEEMDKMYVFPIYSDIDDTEYKKYERMKYAIYLVNVNLKRIGDSLGIPNITFYAARHTYASNLYHAEVPTSLIAQNMGRSPAEIDTYLKAFEQSKILEANEKTFITGQEDFKEGRKDKPVDEKRKQQREEFAAKKRAEEQKIIDEFGSVEAYNNYVQSLFEQREKELAEMFGDDTDAKIEYLKNH